VLGFFRCHLRGSVMAMATIQSVVRCGWRAFSRSRKFPPYVRKAMQRIGDCRTAALGGHVKACRCGHLQKVWYNSCKHRSCPQCAFLEIEKWLYKQKQRLLNCDHYHVVFTVPAELNDIWAFNRKHFANLLFTSVRDSLLKLLADPKYLGARPGLIMALHTWGKTLIVHPHIHCLVTGGGLTTEGEWKTVRKRCLLPRKVLMIIFRAKLLDALRRAADRGQLTLPSGTRLATFRGLLNRLGRNVWNVKLLERFDQGPGVLTYLARYLRGGPISNRRLVGHTDKHVTFRYQDNRDADKRTKLMTLTMDDFLNRLIQHIPPPGMQTVRSFGLYANNKAEELNCCRRLLGQAAVEPSKPITAQEALTHVPNRQEEVCPRCGSSFCQVLPLSTARDPPKCRAA